MSIFTEDCRRDSLEFLGALEYSGVKVWGITESGLSFALALGSAKFGGNVKFVSAPRQSGRAWRLRLSHVKPGAGSRIYNDTVIETGHMGDYEKNVRRKTGPAVCWHAHREFIRAIFDINSDARVQTSFALYRNKEDFDNKMLEIARMPDAEHRMAVGVCDCKEKR